MNEVKMPPTIGAAIRFITSEPVPIDHITGNKPMQVVAKVMNFGRSLFAAPIRMTLRKSANDLSRPVIAASS